jgi:hypothetical protein
MPEESIEHIDFNKLNKKSISAPLVEHIYTADPSAHYFNSKIYIYPSHDIDAGEALMILVVILQWKITMLFLWIQ